MFAYYETYESSVEFAMSLMKGRLDRPIYKDLRELVKYKGHHRFKNLDPTEYFEFEIVLSNEEEPLIITPWNMNNSYKYNPDISELERKIIMLLACIIRDKHAEISDNLKYEKETNYQLNQVY